MSSMSNRIEVSDDETVAPTPAAPPPKAEAKPEPKEEPAPKQKDEGSDWVDIEDPALKARFNRLYRHTKEANEKAARTERQVALLAEQNKKLQQALETMYSGMKDQKTQEELKSLKQTAKEALATGDTEAFVNVNERLLEIKADAKTPKVTPPPAQAPAISQTEMQVLSSWQNQTDDNNEPLRPWANPNHPEFATTQDMIRRVVNEDGMQDVPIRQILAEVDRRMEKLMGVDEDEEPKNTVRRVFSAPRSSRPAPQERGSLNAQERVIAEAMFMGGRGALARSAKDAHDLYLKQKRALSRVVAVED
jgi:hypothetical protein